MILQNVHSWLTQGGFSVLSISAMPTPLSCGIQVFFHHIRMILNAQMSYDETIQVLLVISWLVDNTEIKGYYYWKLRKTTQHVLYKAIY